MSAGCYNGNIIGLWYYRNQAILLTTCTAICAADATR